MTQNFKTAVDEFAGEVGSDQRRQDKMLKKLMPPDADELTGKALTIYGASTTKYAGYLSQDPTSNYKAGQAAGALVGYLINDATFTLETPTPATGINAGGEGSLELHINGVLKDSFDLGAAYNPANEESNQTWTPANSPANKLTIVSVGVYNTFWQKVVARLNLVPADLRKGYNTITLKHTGTGLNQVSQDFEVYYDTATNTPTVSVPSLQIHSNANPKWLSGIKYLGQNDQVKISVTGTNLVDNSYVADPLVLSGLHGAPTTAIAPNDGAVSGLSTPPVVGQTMIVTNKVIDLNVPNQCTADAKVTVLPKDPFGAYSAQQSVSQNLLINTFSTRSSATVEHFDDETYRLPLSFGQDDKTSAITGQWNSSQALGVGNAQQGVVADNDNGLMYPVTNYSSGYTPAQTANYAGRSGNHQYLRCIQGATAKSSIQLVLDGISAGISPVGSGDVNIEVRLPSQTGWLDCAKAYNGTSVANDGDGCMVGGISYAGNQATLNATFGTKSSFGSNLRCLVRITLRNSNRVIKSIVTTW